MPRRVPGSVAMILFCTLAMSAQSTIHNGAKIYVENMNGFGDYFIAALHTKKVPITVVTDKAKADYIVDGEAQSSGSHVRATIKLVSMNDEVAFACSYDQDYTIHGKQSAAEDCATPTTPLAHHVLPFPLWNRQTLEYPLPRRYFLDAVFLLPNIKVAGQVPDPLPLGDHPSGSFDL